MLTPEVTGQVRARLAQDLAQANAGRVPQDPDVEPPPPAANYYTPQPRAGTRPQDVTQASTGSRPAFGPTPSVGTASAPHLEPKEGVVWTKKTPVVGFLVSFDSNPNGDIYELRSGRLMISSEASGAAQNYLVVKDDSVSMNHAILRISANGDVQVLDQLSEYGTKIKRFGVEEEVELSGDKGNVEHGDIISFGKRHFHVCMISLPPVGE